MSDTENPWQSPHAETAVEKAASQDILTPVMIQHLKDAAPWIRFLGIAGYIGAAFSVALGIVAFTADVSRLSLLDISLGLPWIATGVAVFFPARFTHKFGVKIRQYLLSGWARDLETAFRYNRALWKFSGILAIVCLSLISLLVIGSIAAAFIAAPQGILPPARF
jgi:hypothetical protein